MMKRKLLHNLSLYIFLFFSLSSYAHTIEYWKGQLVNEVKGKSYDQLMQLYRDKHNMEQNKKFAYAYLAYEECIAKKNLRNAYRFCRDIGLMHENNNELTDAMQIYNTAENLAMQLSDTALVTIYIDIAIVQRKMFNYQVCKGYYDKIIEIALKINDIESLEYAYHNIGKLYQTTGEYDKSVTNFLKSLEIADKRNNKEGVAMSKQSIAYTMMLAKNNDLALNTIEEAYSLAKNTPDTGLIVNCLRDYGQILTQAGKYETALEKYNLAMQMFGTEDNKPYVAKILLQIADVYLLMGENQLAENYLFKCLNEYESFTYNQDLAVLYLKVGDLYISKNNEKEAAKNYRKGLLLCEKYELKETYAKTARALSKIEEKNGNLALALSLLKRATTIEEQLTSEANTKSTAELQYKFNSAKSTQEIQELKLKQNQFSILGLGALLAITILVFFGWFSLKNKSNRDLLVKNQEIERQNRKLEESNTALREFAYASAHDLKEPLRNIGSFISLLQRKYGASFNEEANEYMAFVKNGVVKMNNLLEDLLHYSTIVADRNEVNDEKAKISEVLNDVKINLSNALSSADAQLEYKNNLPELKMSRLHQTQLFQNLISNAIKFTEKKPIVRINCVENDNNMLISIADNGIGIKEEYSDKVFKLFNRLSRNGKYEGTGVGLTICKSIVEKYNGKIWFESIENQGTTFFLQLPK